MHHHRHTHQQELRQPLQLTVQLQRSLRKLYTSRKKIREREGSYVDDQDFGVTKSRDRKGGRMRVQMKEVQADNEMLGREVMALKEEVRELKREVTSYKKYVKFLQDYNTDLKRQMVFWMSKPSKLDIPSLQIPPPDLKTEILKLRSQNEARQKELASLKNTLNDYIQTESPQLQPHHFILRPLQSKQLHKKSQTSKMKSKQCTSCSYSREMGQPVMNFKKSSAGMKRKKLCECHRRYIETSQFML